MLGRSIMSLLWFSLLNLLLFEHFLLTVTRLSLIVNYYLAIFILLLASYLLLLFGFGLFHNL